jgi:hypothetical protein
VAFARGYLVMGRSLVVPLLQDKSAGPIWRLGLLVAAALLIPRLPLGLSLLALLGMLTLILEGLARELLVRGRSAPFTSSQESSTSSAAKSSPGTSATPQ